MCFDYRRQHKLPIKMARIFDTYGPRMQPNDGRVVSNFIMQALQNQPVTLYGAAHSAMSMIWLKG